jgi:hypothetical protein
MFLGALFAVSRLFSVEKKGEFVMNSSMRFLFWAFWVAAARAKPCCNSAVNLETMRGNKMKGKCTESRFWTVSM